MKNIYQLLLLLLIGLPTMAQIRPQSNPATPTLKVNGLDLDYFNPKEYTIADVTLTGAKFLDKDVIITLSKLIKGERIVLPGEATANAIKILWEQVYLMMCSWILLKLKGIPFSSISKW